MERLVEVGEPEACIDFAMNCKCRATVRLRSLCATAPIAFKIQTSSPNKFLVNPPTGLIPPLSSATFQVILKPQSQLPPTFPRSPSDRFLIRAAEFVIDSSPDSLNLWFASRPYGFKTQDIKIKVAFVGPVLLRHAVSCGDLHAVRNLIKRRRPALAELAPTEAESLLRLATELDKPEDMVHLLLEAGLRIEKDGGSDGYVDPRWGSKGWDELHVAVVFDQAEEVLRLSKERPSWTLDSRDHKGRTPLHLAAEKGIIRCGQVLAEAGADKNARCNEGRTALYRAAVNGDRPMVEMLIQMGADPTIRDHRGRSALDVARQGGHKELVEIMEQGEAVLAAARTGDLKKLESLLKRGAAINYRDQYGLTPLHAAAMKGHREVILMLTESELAVLDLECEDNEGHAPLHMAAEGGDLETVRVLVNKGADVNAKNKRGATPLYMARILGYDDIREFLVSMGALSSPL